MSQFLPLRANIEWLKKAAKQRLNLLQADDPQAQLSDAQLVVARDYGFASWRKLVAHVEEVRDKLRALVPANAEDVAAAPPIAADDADLPKLFAAIQAGETKQVTELLSRRPGLARAHDKQGQTPLHAAAEYNDPQLGVILLAYGADPNAKYGESGHTALSWAVTCNATEFAQTLVRLGNKPDLFVAAGLGAVEELQACFDESGELLPNAAKTGSTRYTNDGTRLPCPPPTSVEQISDALYMASRNGHLEAVRFLLTKRPDLSFKGYLGGTALHWAHCSGSAAVIKLLEAAGADPTARDNELRCTPRAFGICVPASWGFVFLLRPRLDVDPSLVNFTDGQTTPLHEAARAGHVEAVRFLLERGADRTLRDADGKLARDVAVQHGHAAVAELL